MYPVVLWCLRGFRGTSVYTIMLWCLGAPRGTLIRPGDDERRASLSNSGSVKLFKSDGHRGTQIYSAYVNSNFLLMIT